jgi:hypothetical protein
MNSSSAPRAGVFPCNGTDVNFLVSVDNYASPTLLNNCAVAYLQAGRLDGAMKLLSIGLTKLRDQFLSVRKTISFVDEVIEDLLQVRRGTSRKEDDSPTTIVSGVQVFVHVDTGLLDLYNRALLIVQSQWDEQPDVLCAVILFNMGLVHHGWGLTHPSLTNKFLSSAHQLYQSGLDILQRYSIDAIDPLLRLALLNNKAHIEAGLLQADEMHDDLKAMETILVDREVALLDAEDNAIFHVNLICNSDTFAPAPAA